ncbi:MAG: hypothetical protein QXF52_01925 [Thermoproteota archaeon]
MKSMLEDSLRLLESLSRIGVAGLNFKRLLTYLFTGVFKDYIVIMLDLNDEFSTIARTGGTRYYNVVEHSINPVKPPCQDKVEQYIESLVEIIDYCFGVLNMKSIVAKALLDNIPASSETTIPEIASKLDFETSEGGLSIYTPFEPFTFGSMRRVFGRREELDFNDVLESGIVFDFSGLATASFKSFATLTVLNKLSRLEPKQRTIVAVTCPSIVWPRNRRRDNAQLYTEGVLLEELERKGYSILIAEKTLSEVSERITQGLDSTVFSPPSEAFNTARPWRTSLRSEPVSSNYSAAILTRSGETVFFKIPANIIMRPLDGEEREKRKPVLKSFNEQGSLKEDLGEDYEAGVKILERIRRLGGKAGLNSLVEDVRTIAGAGGLRVLATLLRQGYLKQLHEEGEQYLVLSKGEWR